MTKKGLQETYAPHSICFGCGPSNSKGLKIRSIAPEGPEAEKGMGEVIAHFKPEPHHAAFEGILNGGIIGALMDCHSNWTAAWHLMKKSGVASPPSTVTAYFNVKLSRPTPMDQEIRVVAFVKESHEDRALIEAKVEARNSSGEWKRTASCEGMFVRVEPGHPAYHRW